MLELKPPLPPASSSMALAVLRLETISRTIHDTYSSLASSDAGSNDAYAHFRARAYLLLNHYVDHGLQDAFQWLLLMNSAAPKKIRITLQENPFHWGLLAMTAVAGTFMSPNKLRDLAFVMKDARAAGVPWPKLEAFILDRRKRQRKHAVDAVIEAIMDRHAKTERQR
jgi:hypothetical protein